MGRKLRKWAIVIITLMASLNLYRSYLTGDVVPAIVIEQMTKVMIELAEGGSE